MPPKNLTMSLRMGVTLKNLESNSQKLFTGVSVKVTMNQSVNGQTERGRLNLGALIRKDRNLMWKDLHQRE